MVKLKKFIVIILIICILFPGNAYALTQEQAGETIAQFAEDLVNNYKSEFVYSWADKHRYPAYKLQKTTGVSEPHGVSFQNKYAVDCVGFVSFVIHNSIGIGNEDFTFFVTPQSGAYAPYFEEISPKPDLSNLQRGDIIFNSSPHVMIYIGNGKVAHCISRGISIDNVNSFNDGATDYAHVARISKSTAENINENNCTTMFNKVTGAADDYGKYYGTTTGHYAGSYTLGEWLFSKFVGFFDYLAGIITYIFRMQFLGWGNIIEELINYSIKDATGVEKVTVDKSEENSEEKNTYSPGTENLYTPTASSTNTVWSTDRIDIEDIIYNRVPLLDVNFLDVNLDRYKKIEEAKKAQAAEGEEVEVISKDSIVYALRANIAKWYIVIRQICIIVLLLLLIYLGIRLAISTVASDKAKYKGMLWAWLASFIVVFCIHYYMMIVIDINEVLVDIFAEVSQNAIENSDNGTGSQSIYDTMRTRAYSLKLSEGFPATIFYLVLIYFLVRFLFIYIKRYFTIMILALMGPIMSLKNCFDKISTGKSKSMSKWMYDFALNVFLQTIHAILYCLFMVIAFDLATNSVVGFVMSLIVLNFIFKAEKIFMNIFNFEGRATSLRDVNENKNYFVEAYKVGIGVTMFGGTALKFGVGAVAGTGKFLGLKGLNAAQVGVSSFNWLKWSAKNRRAIRNGQGPIEYTPVDLREKLKDKVENTKDNISDNLNNFIYNTTGLRSARLDLHNLKKRDPFLYEQTKKSLKLKKDLTKRTLKRTFGDSTKSIRYMAELMIGVPMLVIDTQSGISTLMDATTGLKDMSERDLGYGHKREINGRKGNLATTALNAATFGGLNATVNSAEKMKKEMKKLKDNNSVYRQIEKANDLEFEIQKEVDRMIADGKSKDVKNIMKDALDQVMSSSKVKKAVGEYMANKGIMQLKESDINEIVDNINKQIFADNVDKVVNKYMKDNSKEKLDKDDFDKILDKIGGKVGNGVSGVLNNTENIDNKRPDIKDIKVDSESITADYMEEKNITKLGKKDIKEIQKRVDKETKKQVEAHVYKDVKKARDEYMKQENIQQLTAEEVKELLTSDASHSSFGIETTEEIRNGIASIFDTSKGQEKTKTKPKGKTKVKVKSNSKKAKTARLLDKKQAVNAIEDAILAGSTTDTSDLSKMMRELKTLKEKTKNSYGRKIVNLEEFTKGIKDNIG